MRAVAKRGAGKVKEGAVGTREAAAEAAGAGAAKAAKAAEAAETEAKDPFYLKEKKNWFQEQEAALKELANIGQQLNLQKVDDGAGAGSGAGGAGQENSAAKKKPMPVVKASGQPHQQQQPVGRSSYAKYVNSTLSVPPLPLSHFSFGE